MFEIVGVTFSKVLVVTAMSRRSSLSGVQDPRLSIAPLVVPRMLCATVTSCFTVCVAAMTDTVPNARVGMIAPAVAAVRRDSFIHIVSGSPTGDLRSIHLFAGMWVWKMCFACRGSRGSVGVSFLPYMWIVLKWGPVALDPRGALCWGSARGRLVVIGCSGKAKHCENHGVRVTPMQMPANLRLVDERRAEERRS